ncbi:aminotransferase class V-fold PLP-dependent enzyme [Caproiciproducens faecalis]|uniref:Aminotransferase class V-fold PLP-dependent enzyme n=1 Tax=Caproiciproducens faecalis TaxID=2820301 RepID=A0ABS7DM73_9FIRM|nr:aminotransferase class V-fold PLP-dependent enzyme [Caproiciproducens faecalis]MBW7571925.1 aminotransferase class V-fold PLP-dependent enzyme [Caproiciproducens faecalis]
MDTFPLSSLTLEQAKALQFRIVDIAMRHFDGFQILSEGDLGVVKGKNKPEYTRKVENIIAELFHAEDAVLVRGAGTGAIRWGLASILRRGRKLLVHSAPVYPTTQVTLETMNAEPVRADFNCTGEIEKTLDENPGITAALVQLTRQKIDDSYDCGEVIQTIKSKNPSVRILTDDNYAVLKVPQIGVQCGADLSAFSCFKLLGPAGVGALVGSGDLIRYVCDCNYSGGSQVQGYEAMAVLRGMVYAPMALAVQAEVGEELVKRLRSGEIPEVKNAFLANAQSKVLLVEFQEDIAEQVLECTAKHGAAAYPVGCESKFEFVPMMYRISGTVRQQDPALEKRMIRINPMRGGAETVMRILKESLQETKQMKGE